MRVFEFVAFLSTKQIVNVAIEENEGEFAMSNMCISAKFSRDGDS